MKNLIKIELSTARKSKTAFLESQNDRSDYF